jgi:hypothetical protein
MTIQINNYTDLLEFIKRKDITVKQATEIVCKALNLVCIFEKSKDEVIKDTEYHIKTFCQNTNSERPIFLGQTNIEFSINDF